jgi:hypothetical protein
MNIVQLIMNQLGGAGISDKLAGLLGIGQDKARAATGAAVPALLAGLTQVASTPDGARKLDAAVDSIDDSDDLVSLASRGASEATSGTGSGLLQSLFGSSMLSGLGTALSKFTGLGAGSITSLLGALAPMVLGFLKGQKRSLGLDAAGLAGLLSSQKNNIMAAMPSGLGSLLGGVPGLSSLTDAGRSVAAGAAGDAYDRGREAVGDTYDRGRAAVAAVGGRAKTPAWMWAIPVALLVGLLAWMLLRSPRGADRTASAPQPTTAPAVEPLAPPPPPVAIAPPSAAPATAAVPGSPDLADSARTAGARLPAGMPAGADVATQFTDVTKQLSQSLSSITDAASADAALPKLREASQKLDSIAGLTSSLPADAKTRLVSLADASRSTLRTAADRAMAIPGVGDKLRPVVDELMKKIDALAGR